MDDLISRQAAIDAIAQCTNCGDEDTLRKYVLKHNLDNGWTGGILEALNAVKDLPTVQPEPQWIPVSERLPEDLSEVNVTWVNHNPEPYYEFTKDKQFTATAVYYKNEWYWYSATCVDYLGEYGRCDWNKVDEAIEIIAWMPLPEAYKPNK